MNLKQTEGFTCVFSCTSVLSNFVLHVFPVPFTDGWQRYVHSLLK